MGPKHVFSLWVKVERQVIVIKGLYTFPKAFEIEPHHQMVSFHIQESCSEWVIYPCNVTVSIFYRPRRLGFSNIEMLFIGKENALNII